MESISILLQYGIHSIDMDSKLQYGIHSMDMESISILWIPYCNMESIEWIWITYLYGYGFHIHTPAIWNQ